MKKILLLFKNYKKRIIKPIDLIKQPSEDLARAIGKSIYYMLNGITQKKFNTSASVKRILFIRRNKLGDAVSILPTIQAIKEKHPNIIIDIIANPYNKIIFKLSSFVNNTYSIPDRYLKNRYLLFFHPKMKNIRKFNKYDIVIGATGSYSSATAWLAFCVSATHKAGIVSNSGHLMDLIYTIKINHAKVSQEIHQVKKIAFLAKSCGLINSNDRLPTAKLTTYNITEKSNIVALCPITHRVNSKWSDNNWCRLSEILDNLNIKYVWIGHKPNNASDKATVDHPEKVREFIEYLSSHSIVVCSEGGTSHIAPALGCHTIILSGVNISQSWIPWSNKIILFEKTNRVDSINPKHIAEQINNQINHNCFTQSNGGVFNESFNS